MDHGCLRLGLDSRRRSCLSRFFLGDNSPAIPLKSELKPLSQAERACGREESSREHRVRASVGEINEQRINHDPMALRFMPFVLETLHALTAPIRRCLKKVGILFGRCAAGGCLVEVDYYLFTLSVPEQRFDTNMSKRAAPAALTKQSIFTFHLRRLFLQHRTKIDPRSALWRGLLGRRS